jgi:hypothetical protein
MSGWTILTLRGKQSKDYEYCRHDDTGRRAAQEDIAATAEEDDRVHKWTTNYAGHVYVWLNSRRYDFDAAEELFDSYQDMLDDAVVVAMNDTSDTGVARYYDRPGLQNWTDQYEETQTDDGYLMGRRAAAVITARHGIVVRCPWHHTDRVGRMDDAMTAGKNHMERDTAEVDE